MLSGCCCRCPGSCLEGNCMNLAKSNWTEPALCGKAGPGTSLCFPVILVHCWLSSASSLLERGTTPCSRDGKVHVLGG